MNIPQGFLELAIGGVIAFVFKVVIGLITKNEQKSDEADQRLEGEIKNLHREMKEVEQRYRNNDRELYGKIELISVKVADVVAQIECMRGKA